MRHALAAILQRPRTVLTLLAFAVITGLTAYVTIPKEANPDIDVPVFYVSVTQQGISPEDSERLLVRPIETQMRNLDGLKRITSIASEGHAGIVIEFTIDFDKDAALADVRAKVDQARAQLPADADEPTVTETNFAQVPTISVALSGEVPERTLYQSARRLKDVIQAIPTVQEVNLTGHREELLEVIIDQTKLESYDISAEELIRAVTQNNRLIPAGALDSAQGRFNVKVPGLFQTARDVMELPVKVSGDGVVTLGDVTEIRRTFKDPTQFTRVNGHPAITLEVVKRLGTNIIENNLQVRDAVARFTGNWPETIQIDFLLDQSTFIEDVLGSLESSVMTAIALVMIVVLAGLGLRSSLLVGLAIPVSFLMAFLLLATMGRTVNMMILFGLVLTVGMLVDGAIVMVEYADRRIAEGMNRREAFIRAAQQMFWPITSSTATTLAAFLPLLLWPGVAGEFMSYLPLMVIITLTAALVTALVFLPVMGRFLGRKRIDPAEIEAARNLTDPARFNPDTIPGFTGIYARTIRRLIRRPGLVLLAALGLSVAIVGTFAANPTGVTFFIDEEPSQAVVMVSARGNLSTYEQRDLVREVERDILTVSGIKNTIMVAGKGGGAPKIGGVQDPPADMIGQFMLEFEDFSKRRMASVIFDEIRTKTADIPGIHVEIRQVEGGPPTGKAIRLEVNGADYESVRAATARVRAHVEQMEGLRDREDTRPLPGIEWQLSVDRTEAGRFGTDVTTVGSMVQLVTNGILLGKYRPDDSEDEVDIRVRLPQDERSLDRLDALNVRTPQGLVPIRNFVTREARQQVTSITRTDGRYSMLVKADVVEGVFGDDKVRELDAWLQQQDWPAGVGFIFRGADEDQKESQAFLGNAMMVSLFMMFIILVTQFNSFYQSILTLMTVVLSIFGVLLGMIVTQQPFSIIMTGTGVLALAGIVVNNAIILLDTFNEKRHEAVPVLDAVVMTAAERMRPIMLTTITTMIGLLPMALQITIDFFTPAITVGSATSSWWVQLSTAVIFGLGFSTLLTLVLIPVMLAAPSLWGEALGPRLSALRARFSRNRPAPAAPVTASPAEPRPYPEAAE